jgi:GxxExxY protein
MIPVDIMRCNTAPQFPVIFSAFFTGCSLNSSTPRAPYLQRRMVSFSPASAASTPKNRKDWNFPVSDCFSPVTNTNTPLNGGSRIDVQQIHETLQAQCVQDERTPDSTQQNQEGALILSFKKDPVLTTKRLKSTFVTQPVYDSMIALAHTVFKQYGTGYTERVYQEGMYLSAYKKNIPCLMERHVYVTHDSSPLFIGKVDLEVAGRFVFELKIHPFNTQNLKKDRIQIEKYLRAYALNSHVIDRAALIYFTPDGVRVVEVEPFFACHVNV